MTQNKLEENNEQPSPVNDWEIEFKKEFIKILNNFSHNEGYERGETHLFYKNNDMSDPQYLCRNDKFWDRLEPGGLLLRNDLLNFIRAQIDLERKKVIEEIRENIEKISVSGGGNGQRLKIQILDFLNKL